MTVIFNRQDLGFMMDLVIMCKSVATCGNFQSLILDSLKSFPMVVCQNRSPDWSNIHQHTATNRFIRHNRQAFQDVDLGFGLLDGVGHVGSKGIHGVKCGTSWFVILTRGWMLNCRASVVKKVTVDFLGDTTSSRFSRQSVICLA